MIHLYNADIMQVFKNFEKSGSRYVVSGDRPNFAEERHHLISNKLFRFLLMTTQSNNANEELGGSRYRAVNFFKEPFCLDAPLCIAEDTKLGMIYIMLIDLRSIKDLVD